MAAYYENPQSQWTAAPQQVGGWDHATPPPARSGASSVIPREEPTAFSHQIEEVERAIDNLMKSGKMYGAPGVGRREFVPPNLAVPRRYPGFDPRAPGGGPGSRPHSVADFGDVRGGPPPHQNPTNLQNFYATQRHQTSRGSNEAEQMMQAKRRMAAQRERELRNYHQEQQYNRTALVDPAGYNKPDRTLSPSSLPEEERRKLIAQQRQALYGENDFPVGPSQARGFYGGGPMYDTGRAALGPVDHNAQGPMEGGQGPQSAGANDQARANSNSSPQSNPGGGAKGIYDAPLTQQTTRTSASSPGGSPPRQASQGGKPGQGSVAPIGTRPSVSGAPSNPTLNKRSTTPLPSPLSQGYNAGGDDNGASIAPASATTETANVGLSGWGGRGGWGNSKPQASVWG
ncbi:hypothetical protein QBC40DRAFT_307231 [Triangularia verruculosa]|uniref:Uncharacterized protein n=1 Tax=Triangularia verruculosa TaxID=2587418 RepID=A0AAN6XLA4_9PEZI|nr:hypothetical protein QBC40DRAFT_307231 [Triangularia verruculosa]